MQFLKKLLFPVEENKVIATKKPHYHHLRKRWTKRHAELKERVWQKHKESLDWANKNFSPHQLTAGGLGGLMLMAPVTVDALPAPQKLLPLPEEMRTVDELNKNSLLLLDFSGKIPTEYRPLVPEEEERVASILSHRFGFKVSAELEGKRLERSYGLIGAEQHLARYPGDTMASHFANEEDAKKYWSSGMAPGLGAWRYFAPSQSELTEEAVMQEKYYIAVQTFRAPGYSENTREYSQFFKHRKMLVVNPHNGKAVVAVIGDAGPAVWTGKHLGGSPEVMKHLERVDGRARGPVIFMFIDDPENKVPLGPVNVM